MLGRTHWKRTTEHIFWCLEIYFEYKYAFRIRDIIIHAPSDYQKTREGCGCCSLVLLSDDASMEAPLYGSRADGMATEIVPSLPLFGGFSIRAPGRDLVRTFHVGCFLKSTVPAFSSFSETKLFSLRAYRSLSVNFSWPFALKFGRNFVRYSVRNFETPKKSFGPNSFNRRAPPNKLGLGFCTSLAQMFFVASIFQRDVQTDFCAQIFVQLFGVQSFFCAQMFAHIFAHIFL